MKKVLWILQGIFFCAAFFFLGLHEQGEPMTWGWLGLASMTAALVLVLIENRAEHKKIARICRNRIQGKHMRKTNYSISQKGGFVKRENSIPL